MVHDMACAWVTILGATAEKVLVDYRKRRGSARFWKTPYESAIDGIIDREADMAAPIVPL